MDAKDLTKARKKLNFPTAKEAAKAIGVSRRYWEYREFGDVAIKLWMALAVECLLLRQEIKRLRKLLKNKS